MIRQIASALLLALAVTAPQARAATGGPMTADQAVQIALRQGTQAIQAEASLLDARSGLWSAYSGVLPHVSADASRSGGKTRESSPSGITDDRGYNGSYGLSGSWGVLNLSSWASVSSARRGSAAAKYERAATRAQIVLDTKRLGRVRDAVPHERRLHGQPRGRHLRPDVGPLLDDLPLARGLHGHVGHDLQPDDDDVHQPLHGQRRLRGLPRRRRLRHHGGALRAVRADERDLLARPALRPDVQRLRARLPRGRGLSP